MSLITVREQMRELSLIGMLESVETDLTIAKKQDWSVEELLSKLLQSEKDQREMAFVNKKIKSAQFKRNANLEDFDFKVKRSITKSQVQDLMTMQWLEQGRPLILVGQTGVGKSFLAEAIGRYACSYRKTVLYKDATELFLMIAEGRRLNRYLTTRKRLSALDVLIIDDFGMRKLGSTEAQDLKELLEQRSFTKSTIFTTQLPLEHWKEVIEDEVILEAIIDLIEHSSIKLEIKGESYRKTRANKLDSKSTVN